MNNVKEYDIASETTRTYTIYCIDGGGPLHIIDIPHPKKLYWATGHAFHRIFDGKIMHLCPAPGILRDADGDVVGYVEMTWRPANEAAPCQF